MPDERFFHKRLGHSKKVNVLTDLEFRVWAQYQLSADDCGVMRNSAIAIQADNDALATRPAKAIQKALDKIVAVGLLMAFDHQGRQDVCQANWNDFQKVRFPRATVHPAPPGGVLAKCSSDTRKLFQIRHGDTAGCALSYSGETSEISPAPAGAGGREWLTANGNGDGAEQTAALQSKRAGAFVDRYRDLHERYRGAAYIGNPRKDYEEALQLVAAHDDETLDQLATVFLNADDDFAKSRTATVAMFRSRATWCEERLNAEKKRRGIV